MSQHPNDTELLAIAASVLQTEADAVRAMQDMLGEDFLRAARTIFKAKGHCIVSGLGKSGHIGRKIAATLSSTGTPAFFIHPTEASHGDLGMIPPNASVLALSNSGQTRELRDLITHCKANQIPLIAITGQKDSFLSKQSDVTLLLPDAPEACPNQLAPTTSTTAALALGDALAVIIMHLRGFSREDFSRHHPGGKLGLRLQKVHAYIREYETEIPIVAQNATGRAIIEAITKGRQGCVAVTNATGIFTGMITDGDLRRAMTDEFFTKTAKEIMTDAPITIHQNQLMGEVIEVMMEKRIANIFVLEENEPIGIIHTKDLMQKGYL